jgi:hypothetical protein
MNEIPENTTCKPYPEDWESLLIDNHNRLAQLDKNSPELARLRKEIRTQILNHAHAFSEAKSSTQQVKEQEYHFLGTGHQAEIFHSGVYEKFRLMNEFCKAQTRNHKQIIGISVILDLDPSSGVQLSLPSESSSLKTNTVILSTPEQLPINQRTQMHPEIASRVDAAEKYIHQSRVTTWLTNYYLIPNEPVVTALSRARFYDHVQGVHYSDLAFSELISSQAAQRFFIELCKDWERLSSTYNRELEKHRLARKIKNTANPFPNLERDGEWQELPFWVWQPGNDARERVFAQSRGHEVLLKITDRELCIEELDNLGADVCSRKLVPRGAMVSLFMRLMCFDSFIHGLGGERYDAFTDRIIYQYFQISPPGFITVSRDRYLFNSQRAQLQDLEVKVAALREMYSHPEQALPYLEKAHAEALQTLSQKRRHFITQLSHAEAVERQNIGSQLAETNRAIRELIDHAFGAAWRLEHESLLAQQAVINDRTFPYFLFPLEDPRNF